MAVERRIEQRGRAVLVRPLNIDLELPVATATAAGLKQEGGERRVALVAGDAERRRAGCLPDVAAPPRV